MRCRRLFLFEPRLRHLFQLILTALLHPSKIYFPSIVFARCLQAETSSQFRIARLSAGGRVSSTPSLKGIIVVADNDECVREPLIELLRLNCYRVIAADNGEQAFEAVCSQPVDLVLLEVMMPGPTGITVCRAIKARPRQGFFP